jgi:flagellar assembly protein FliH
MSYNRNSGGVPRLPSLPVTSFQYRELTAALPPVQRIRPQAAPNAPAEVEEKPAAEIEMTRAELEALLAKTAADAAATAEKRVRGEVEGKVEAEAARVGAAIERFDRERKGYFARVEGEVVRLALSIAAKILHREAQVDPMLVAALVQIAISQLKENTAVTVRVAPQNVAKWRARLASGPQWAAVTVAEDPELKSDDCILETELGSANFSLAGQLKEVEQGFFDVLAQTPRD